MRNRFIISLWLISISFNAHAYLDAGTGSIMIQLLFGGVAVVGSFMKIYWHKIKLFFNSKKFHKGTESNSDSDANVSE